MDLPDDDHLSRSVTELGEPDALFRISSGRFMAKLSLGVALLVGGVVGNYFWWFHGPANFDALVAKLLLVPPVSGFGLLWHMYRERGLFVLIYPTGLLRLRRGEVDSFPWTEIDHINLKIQRAGEAGIVRDYHGSPIACWLAVEVPTFQLWKGGLTITREDGTSAHFGPVLTDYDRLAEEVQKRTFAAVWPLVWKGFLDGKVIAFGDLELSRAGVRHAGKFLPWTEVKELTVAQGKFTIKQGGKWLPWVFLDVHDIPNPHVLCALAAEARRIAASPPVLEPKPQARG